MSTPTPPIGCVGCGCTDALACPGGCSWASHNPHVCSECDTRTRKVNEARARVPKPKPGKPRKVSVP